MLETTIEGVLVDQWGPYEEDSNLWGYSIVGKKVVVFARNVREVIEDVRRELPRVRAEIRREGQFEPTEIAVLYV